MIHLFHGARVDRYFSGTLESNEIATLFEGLWRCAACRALYERHLILERLLPGRDAVGTDRLWRSIVGTTRLSTTTSDRPIVRYSGVRRAVLALSLATGAIVLVPRLLKSPGGTAPVPRGAVDTVLPAPTFHLYRTRGGSSERVDGELRADDGVLVAYSNPSSDLSFLMVFGVDSQGGIHWYYPAYERLGQDPEAVPIRTRSLGVELGEEIRHELPLGDLRMFALFLPNPRHVIEVEGVISGALAAHGGSVRALDRLPITDGEQTSVLLEVRP
jgi:hypothetical protein